MGRFLLRRFLQNIVTFFLFLTAVYLLLDAQPGDFADLYLSDPRLTPEQRQILRANLGLDRPVMERYGLWLESLFRGDLGVSFSNYPRDVLDIIVERAPRQIGKRGCGTNRRKQIVNILRFQRDHGHQLLRQHIYRIAWIKRLFDLPRYHPLGRGAARDQVAAILGKHDSL